MSFASYRSCLAFVRDYCGAARYRTKDAIADRTALDDHEPIVVDNLLFMVRYGLYLVVTELTTVGISLCIGRIVPTLAYEMVIAIVAVLSICSCIIR